MTTLVLTPAYGRDYRNQSEVRNAWASGQDFAIQPSGAYTSVRDLPLLRQQYNIQFIEIRYRKRTRTILFKAD